MTRFEREVLERALVFDEEDVEAWLGSDEDVDVVPNTMLLSQVAGMLSNMVYENQDAVITRHIDIRYNDPVRVGETVTYRLEAGSYERNHALVHVSIEKRDAESQVASGMVHATIS